MCSRPASAASIGRRAAATGIRSWWHREVFGGGIGGKAGEPVVQSAKRRRPRSEQPARRAIAAPISPAESPGGAASRPRPAGLQRALHRRHEVACGIGDVGQPCRVPVLRHHDPRQIAVIGARLERAARHAVIATTGSPSARSAATRSAPRFRRPRPQARGRPTRSPPARPCAGPRARGTPFGGGRKKGMRGSLCHGRNP
jgi:hypothetical protein